MRRVTTSSVELQPQCQGYNSNRKNIPFIIKVFKAMSYNVTTSYNLLVCLRVRKTLHIYIHVTRVYTRMRIGGGRLKVVTRCNLVTFDCK